jgi:hypothetical protein
VIEILDIRGKSFTPEMILLPGNNTFRIPLNSLPRGFYTIRITGDHEVLAKKLVIQK